MKKRILSLIIACAGIFSLRADEGMWPLVLLQKIQDPMQAAGLKLTAEDIYSINNASVKDAVVRLMTKQGRMFCTGEVISSKGLFLTNHHCGYGAIADLSSPSDNILANGFWAKTMEQERPANFNIGFLRKIEDVTQAVLEGTTLAGDDKTRAEQIKKNLEALNTKLKDGLGADKNNYSVEISSFYSGNQYLAMFYEVYRDIRLVGTPPENVGKFGGETDNWRWPRHTCDFSMFRIYANADNKPADFSKENDVYEPKKFLPVSLNGAVEGEFSMTLGYPGRTTRYTYSEGIKYLGNKERPMRVELRRGIMDAYEKYMKMDDSIRLMYSDKLAGLGNYWNKFKGEAADLSKPGLYEKRKAAELAFEKWVRDNNKTAEYGDVTGLYDDVYRQLNQYGLYPVYFQDGIVNSQVMSFAMQMTGLEPMLKDKAQAEAAKGASANMAKGLDDMFKDFHAPIEKEVLASVIMRLSEDLDHQYLPALLNELVIKYKRDYNKVAEYLWMKSMFSSKAKMGKFLAKPSAKALAKDPVYNIVSRYLEIVRKDLKPVFDDINQKLDRANRLFLSAQLQMNTQAWAPDANATMRLSYGKVMDYDPQDGVHNKAFTTANGYLQKYIPGDFEFDAPPALLDLIRKKDFGQYADKKDGELHTCFLSNNDITGGNSGSPVINGNGELIGIAFDGNYEAISSDFMFMPDLQRTISVDIRFVLFIIDKFGGAKNVIDELTLVK